MTEKTGGHEAIKKLYSNITNYEILWMNIRQRLQTNILEVDLFHIFHICCYISLKFKFKIHFWKPGFFSISWQYARSGNTCLNFQMAAVIQSWEAEVPSRQCIGALTTQVQCGHSHVLTPAFCTTACYV